MKYAILMTVTAALTVVGCMGESNDSTTRVPANQTDQRPDQPSSNTGNGTNRDVVLSPEESVTETSATATEDPSTPVWAAQTPQRIRKRMNVDQLSRAINQVSGGLNWRQNNDDNLLETLSLTLGKPDYLEVTNEDLGAGVLFMKFLEDAAGNVCTQMVTRDLEEGSDFLVASTDDIDTQLTRLLQSFHSRQLNEGHPDLKQWRWLYDSALRISDEATEAWRTVCVALFRHPDFYTY